MNADRARWPRLDVGPLLPVGLVAALYAVGIAGPFILDDLEFIGDTRLRSAWPPWGAMADTTRPILKWSLALNYAIGGRDPTTYHVANIVIHALAAAVLYGIIRRTLLLRAAPESSARSAALAVSVLWAIHPLQTESVTYIVQRAESLMGLCYLLTLYAAIRAGTSDTVRAWTCVSVMACGIGMATKEVMITAPLVVLIYDRLFLSPSWPETLRRRWSLHAGLLATWGVVAGLWMWNVPPRATATAGFGTTTTMWSYALTQSEALVYYLKTVFWPEPLCLDHGWTAVQHLADVAVPLGIVAALLFATVWALWQAPLAGFAGLWFFAILAPTSSILPIDALVAEHRMYLPLAGVLAGGVCLIAGAGRRVARLGAWPERGVQAAGLLGIVLAALTLSIMTIQRNKLYRSPEALWEHNVEHCSGSFRAQLNYGQALLERGMTSGAIAHFQDARTLRPDLARTHFTLGIALRIAGRFDAARDAIDRALEIDPASGEAHNALGRLHADRGAWAAAVPCYEKAIELDPEFPNTYPNLAYALSKLGRHDAGAAALRRAIVLQPWRPELHINLGTACLRLQQNAAAIAAYQDALALNPDMPMAHRGLCLALQQAGRAAEAAAHCAAAEEQ